MLETVRTPQMCHCPLYRFLGTSDMMAKIVLFLYEQEENEIFASGPLKHKKQMATRKRDLDTKCPN
jgi:hypothetical protein